MIEKLGLQTFFRQIALFLSKPIVYKTEVRTGRAIRIVDVAGHIRLREAMILRRGQLQKKCHDGQLSSEDYRFFISNLRMAFRDLVTAKNIPQS